MKNIIMMLLGIGLTMGATATQPKLAGTGRISGRTSAKVVVVHPYAYYPYRFGYSPFYNPYYGYNAFYYSPFAYRQRPSKLDLNIEQITNDYQHDIAAVRHDKTLAKADRKQKIRDLKHERENSIIEAKKSYYQAREKNEQ